MTRPTIESTLYRKLQKLIPDLEALSMGVARKSRVGEAMMDLNLDVMVKRENVLLIALSHYYQHPSGDLIPDPDMEIEVLLDAKTAQACSYQDAYRYQHIHSEQAVEKRAAAQLNKFLSQWLSNCLTEGHQLAK